MTEEEQAARNGRVEVEFLVESFRKHDVALGSTTMLVFRFYPRVLGVRTICTPGALMGLEGTKEEFAARREVFPNAFLD